MTNRPLTMMAVHAHPDDEVTGTGGVLARYAAEGLQTIVVTCTDGRCGDGAGGAKPGEPGHDPVAVVAMRQLELERSCAILDVSQVELLGYGDSGMMGWPTNDVADAFWQIPVEVAAVRLGELIEKYQPDVIVTYDENGFYGHPDHIQTHRVTMAAIAATGSEAKVYWTTAPKSMVAEFGRIMREMGADWDEPDASGGESEPDIGLPDDQITTWVDARDFAGRKLEALAAHASQTDNIFFLKMGEELFTQLMGIETFVRVDSRTTSAHEDDLFVGLR
jgi:LmbE family N-acetylglucosaminyl deacetylase